MYDIDRECETNNPGRERYIEGVDDYKEKQKRKEDVIVLKGVGEGKKRKDYAGKEGGSHAENCRSLCNLNLVISKTPPKKKTS